MGRTGDESDRAAGERQLDRLRQHEQSLAAQLKEAQAEATRLLDEEQSRVDAARSELADEIRSETGRIRNRMRAAAQEESRNILAEAREEAERLAGVSDGRISQLADGVFQRLFAGAADR